MTEMESTPPAVIVDLAQRYAEQFTTTIETLRRRGAQLGDDAQQSGDTIKTYMQTDVQPALRQQQARITDVVTDMSDVPSSAGGHDTYKFILETYAWTAVCLLGASIGALVGGYALSPLLTYSLSDYYTVALAYAILPYYGYLYNRREQHTSVEDKRMLLFALSVAIGILNGHNLSECYTAAIRPPAFITPLVVAVVAEMVGPKLAANRPAMLGACIGSAAVVHLTIGLVTGSLGAAYLMSTVVSAAIATVGLQYTLASVKNGQADMIEMQLVQIWTTITLGALTAYMMGTSRAKAAEQRSADNNE